MVLLTTTPRILAEISSLSPSDRSKLSQSLSLGTILPSQAGAPIDHKTILALSRLASSTSTSTSSSPSTSSPSLNVLLRGANVYTPPRPAKPQPSAEYVALMAQLRREQERREYAGLVNPKSSRRGDTASSDDDDEDGKDAISPSLVFNILLSVVMCALAMFYLTRWWPNDGLRVLVSLATGLVVGVAESVVYAGYLRKVRMSKEKERAKREKKVFIGEYRGEEDEPAASTSVVEGQDTLVSHSTEKEEIWGRGVNGGMRRRVREKWEKDNEQEMMESAK